MPSGVRLKTSCSFEVSPINNQRPSLVDKEIVALTFLNGNSDVALTVASLRETP
jgi:hypothetical protein